MCKDLTDSRGILQAKRIHYLEVEPLYWKLEDAIYDNKKDHAKAIYEILLYVASYNKPALNTLKPRFLDRLKSIAFELYGDGTGLVRRHEILVRPQIAPISIPFKVEKELNDYLCKNIGVLSKALNDDVQLYGAEVKIDNDYRCDIVVYGNKFYLIELKICQGTHQVVSQINKYCYYFYRKLRYDRYREIQGVVISNGMDAWSINEIRRDGHLCFVIVNDGNGIKLEKVN